ncbi:MAG: PAS domain S-box protein [Methanomicrobiaceae archaeon]|nr:PAS domain S-box protein [Methanomicrobiaceae archaeon]
MFRTLLIDDEPVFLAVSKIFLEKGGEFSCDTCESARAALDLIRNGTFDAVVSDYDMPQMDGIALLKAVRADDPDLPFIVLTGRGREEVVIEALNNGADFYLQKSAEPRALYAELASKIRHAVDRQRAREALKRTQFSIDHLPAEFYWIDSAGYLIDVNEYACQKLGYTRNELFALRVPDVDPDFAVEGFEEAWQEVWREVKEHQTVRMESHHRKRDGTVYPVELSLSSCQMGEKEFMCAFATDITERKRAETAVNAEKERMGVILSALDTGQSLITPDLTIAWVNQKTREFIPDQDPVGQKCHQIYEHRDRPCEQCTARQVFATGEVQTTQKFSPPHGHWYHIVSQPVKDASGAVVQVLTSFADITRQKRMEERLRESREQYRQLVQHSPGGIVIHDGNTVLFCNRLAVEIFGAEDEQDLLGRPVLAFVDPEYRGRVTRRIARIADDTDPYFAPRIDEKFIRLDGSVVDVEVTAGPVTFEGKPAVQVVFHDITERKQKERERRVLEQRLETKIRDLNLLHALSTRYLEGDDLKAILQEILEAAIAITGADKGCLQLLDTATGTLKFAAQKHFDIPFLHFFEHVGPGDSAACGAALERAGRVVVEDICESPVFDEASAEVLREEGIHAVQSTPLVSRNGHLLGILSTHFCRVHTPADRELRLVDILARQAADMIERIRAEERLRASEKNYRDVVEHANSVILKMDTQGTITFFNDFAQRFFGYTHDEILGKNVVGTIVPETESSGRDMREMIREVCTNPEKHKNNENENVTKDGRRVWIQWTNQVISDEHGTAVGVLCIGNDITEQKHAEEALRESEEKYRSLFESSLDGILITDMEGRFIEANQSALAMLGYTAEELTGLTFWQITPKCWHPTEKAMVEDIFARGYLDLYEKEYVRKDGTAFPINIRVWLKKDDAGRPTGMWALVQDITEQKRAEHGLMESEQRLNLAIESAHLGVWDKNLATGGVITHGYWPGILGYADYDDVPPWEDAVHPDDRVRVGNDLHANMKGETPCIKSEYRMKRKDGRYSWILSRGKVVVRDAGGRPLRMIGADHDITALRASQESLREANRKLNLLASITRHDILNQVSAQKAFLALLEEHIQQNAEAQGFFRHLLATADTIRRQITFTGDYQHMGEQDPEWLQVAWVVKRAAESVRLNGTLLEIATPMPEIYADPMLEKAFASLLENATVHAGGLSAIRVSFQTRDGDGVIVMEDDGVGIPAAQKEEIFEKGIGKNTGYGLFLVKEILGITGMSIRECGVEGRGARFEIAIPQGRWRTEQTDG